MELDTFILENDITESYAYLLALRELGGDAEKYETDMNDALEEYKMYMDLGYVANLHQH